MLQLRVAASDSGVPPCSDVKLLHVTVDRNIHAPRMQQDEYSSTVLEVHDVDEPVTQVQGQDDDTRVSLRSSASLPSNVEDIT